MKIILRDNLSLGGFNNGLCIFNFLGSGCCLLFAILSYILKVFFMKIYFRENFM